MTLCFLGECSKEQRGQLIEALDERFVQSPAQAVVWHGERLGRFPVIAIIPVYTLPRGLGREP